ncbi:O-antigen polymerase [Lacinutrix sp. 5H-3-7-4]|uniref:O-antigen polymerase n=1 Tax=Lacinutrix sp. (strain 5H-3-7-4) TaxID=983544 RepID=UPI00020A38A6|nr:O-antigen polymerase [Lacinutrix sp. 5H-3-7-4]AEH00883.1 hypothetical protein Lacal_1035 [Lacinutrix sp. 5H-3-7-4]
MKTTFKSINYLFVSCIGVLLTGIACYFTQLNITVLFSLITLICSYNIFKISIKRLNSFTFFFLLFFTLYTYAPIITVLFEIDNRKLFLDSTPDAACLYLFISTLGLFGMSIPYIINIKNFETNRALYLNKVKQFTLFTVIFVLLAALSEFINIYRAGGFGILKYGKAVYQAKTGGLFITLPSASLLKIGFFFLGLRMYLTYGNSFFRVFKNKLFLFIILISSPIILIYLSVGFRGHLLGVFIAYFVGYCYYLSIYKIKKKVLFFIFLGYSAMAILYGIRGQLKHYFTSGNWDRFEYYVFEQKSYLEYYNPANNEFGAPYMNYIKFYNDDDNKLLYGKSYFEGFLIPIPRVLLPFEKPKPITYIFKDRYFSSWNTSRISGSGFSFVMEAQWNFGILGSFFVYFLLGSFFWFLEYLRNRNKFILFLPLFYAMMLPLAQSIHRSSFGFLMANIIVITLLISVLVLLKKIIPNKIRKEF